jgi:DNA-directed RNA polymerase specialized sigma24 family protein
LNTRRHSSQEIKLTETVEEAGSDPPLQENAFEGVWTEFEGYIRQVVRRQLKRVSLREPCSKLANALISIRNTSLVRRDLAGDEALVEDIVQEFAVAMVGAIRRGRLAAARPAIYGWINKSAWRIVKDHARSAILVALAGTLFQGPANDNAEPAPDPLELALVCDSENPEALAIDGEERVRVVAGVSKLLTANQRQVLFLELDGRTTKEIALELGISERAVRLRRMQVNRRLAAA